MIEKVQRAFRVALRAEGDWLVAYLAATDSMVDTVELGRIGRSVADIDPEVFIAWQSLWSNWSERAVRRLLGLPGLKIEVVVEEAPEHEKSGSA